MGRVVLVIRTVLGVVVVRAAAILVVPDSHALGSRHRGHALDRQGQGKQRDSKKPGDPGQHRRKLYASAVWALQRWEGQGPCWRCAGRAKSSRIGQSGR